MTKKILRIISLAMAVLLLICVLPNAQSTAVQSEEYRITQQVEDTYQKALKAAGRYSFHGRCGSAVDFQLYTLGIITKIIGANGNGQYDLYKYSDYSSGGYRIRAYGASSYTLLSALNAITENGTKNAYNILVGFQRTNTYEGQKYGHCLFVHAIIDGVVYFTEGYTITVDGKEYHEGECVAVSIERFCKSYNAWTTFDGVIHFGLKTYNDSCEEYPAYLSVAVTQEVQLFTAPCTPAVDDRSQVVRNLQVGEQLNVTGLFLNTEGEYWYQVEDCQTCYIPADATDLLSLRYDDVTATGLTAPTVHQQGNIFSIKGTISSTYNAICSVRAQVFSAAGLELEHVMTTTDSVADNRYSLSYSTISNGMAFRKLGVGSYRYELAVVVANYYYADGELQTEWKTIKLYLSDFQVVSQTGDTVTVSYNACGGTTELNAAELSLGQTLNSLPTASRDGYVFDGWYTAAEGGEKVEEDYILRKDITLYAHWTAPADVSDWYMEDGRLYYMMNGQRITGFFQVNGVTYYQDTDGFVVTGWKEVLGLRYYFNANGSMALGWLEFDGCHYYIGVDGTVTVGWAEIDGNTYYFSADGLMLTGVQTIDGQKCTFAEDGKLIAQ